MIPKLPYDGETLSALYRMFLVKGFVLYKKDGIKYCKMPHCYDLPLNAKQWHFDEFYIKYGNWNDE